MSTESETKYTPGPWRVKQYSNYTGWAVFASGRGCIAERWYDDGTVEEIYASGEMGANAHLIAAAPDLYEALETMLRAVEDPSRFWSRDAEDAGEDLAFARAALAEARGENT